MSQPIINSNLIAAAAKLLVAENCSLVGVRLNGLTTGDNETGYECEALLSDARIAASEYLVACFDHAAKSGDDDELLPL